MNFATDHGGPDAQGVPTWDFSTNANACGPAPTVVEALCRADATRYPDPACTALRERLAAFHGVHPEAIVVAASASEFIGRLTAVTARRSAGASVHWPEPGYGDYGRAARAWGLRRVPLAGDASLVWVTTPSSPTGEAVPVPPVRDGSVCVADEAYAPLRLDGQSARVPATAWRLVSPNKALGLTGIRGAYAIAPEDTRALREALAQAAPSWVLGAHGVAMLEAWAEPEAQQWVADSRHVLSRWKSSQWALGESLGWRQRPSVTPYWCMSTPGLSAALPRLRERGIKLRDTTGMGLPDAARVAVLPPAAQAALAQAWREAMP